MALPAVRIETNKQHHRERFDGNAILCLTPLQTTYAPAAGDEVASAEDADWSDDEALSMPALQESSRNGGGERETSASTFSPTNGSSGMSGCSSPTYWSVQNLETLELAVCDAALSKTSTDGWTTHGIVNGRTLDEIFAGDAIQITGSALYELCKIFTMPHIIERTNCGRQADLVTESMLRSRLGEHKRKTLAAGSKCAYDFEYELNHGRHDNGHKSARMPSADLKCGKCSTCLQWRDATEPSKVFEYWTRKRCEKRGDGRDGVESATSAVESAFSAFKISKETTKPAAKRKRSVSRPPCRAKHGVYNDDRAKPASTMIAAKRRKHSTLDPPVTTQRDASANSDSDLQARRVPLRPAQSRKALAAKCTNTYVQSQATCEKGSVSKNRADGGCMGWEGE